MNFRNIEAGRRKARKVLRAWREHSWNRINYDDSFSESGKIFKLLTKTRVGCSCFMCTYEKELNIPHRYEVRENDRLNDDGIGTTVLLQKVGKRYRIHSR